MVNTNKDTEFVIGRHPATETLKSNQDINKVFIQEELKSDAIRDIITLAQKKKIIVSKVPKGKLDLLSDGQNHQGVVVAIAAYKYAEIDDLFKAAASKNEDPFFLILDGIEDPHNLGSIMRTADAAGVHGIIIPKRRAVQLTSTVAKTSTGAIEHVPVARVTNLVQLVKELKKKNVWVFGTDMNGTDFRKWNATGAVALVIGNEGKGISPLLKKECDEMLTIPMIGHVQSLNASVAASLLIYQGFSSRGN
ncbi:23S rRNA (guanosine(2251)-2'-O)-methyltransferase RlmB [Liquorilactobacillus mali]|uniref:23S rRNA (guanosine(2251)-2'-O)-methyltransferase RlmB n=1 Tax=Liquorilactobacillus mali TaxID=1618 RepID=UPI00234FCA7F|nr:23S rRNA (guanosine(2251)-2'-O)-methyltransferase RlmB [Liquorilactobacillus mali]MDC7953302.1 23S rRNA (guanosine(2251)-2'-O)-methyltransferase RlmB [Liquorilactobacillus mali]MDV7756653.1 23S rRNA (guanosine(2251)-2'-O)-methyltransferase RlmB [Liquorilactobacillus mali]